MDAPRFKLPTDNRPKEWDAEALDAMRRDVDSCLEFCGRVNDYLHEERDDTESPEESELRSMLTDVLKSAAKKKLTEGG